MTKRLCRKCHKPSGCFMYCREHRKANAAKARASRQSRRRAGRYHYSGLALSAPIASEAYYKDQAERDQTEQPSQSLNALNGA